MNWYYIRSEIDGKALWIKKSGCPTELPFPARDIHVKTESQPPETPIVLDPKDFESCDIVEVTHHPPIDKQNCVPFEEGIAALLEEMKNQPQTPFKPWVYFNAQAPGGMIEVIWKDVGYYVTYAEGSPHLAYCKSFDDDQIVGVKIENVARLKLRANPENS